MTENRIVLFHRRCKRADDAAESVRSDRPTVPTGSRAAPPNGPVQGAGKLRRFACVTGSERQNLRVLQAGWYRGQSLTPERWGGRFLYSIEIFPSTRRRAGCPQPAVPNRWYVVFCGGVRAEGELRHSRKRSRPGACACQKTLLAQRVSSRRRGTERSENASKGRPWPDFCVVHKLFTLPPIDNGKCRWYTAFSTQGKGVLKLRKERGVWT